MAHRTVKVKLHEDYFQEEGTLTACAVYPGMLLERTSAGTFQAHSTAGGPAEMLIAVEDETQGKEINVVYAASSRVVFVAAQKGDVLAVRITNADSSGQGEISIGEFLESNGDGYFQAWADPTGSTDSGAEISNELHPLMVALEAISMADSSGVHGGGFIKARVL